MLFQTPKIMEIRSGSSWPEDLERFLMTNPNHTDLCNWFARLCPISPSQSRRYQIQGEKKSVLPNQAKHLKQSGLHQQQKALRLATRDFLMLDTCWRCVFFFAPGGTHQTCNHPPSWLYHLLQSAKSQTPEVPRREILELRLAH